MAATCQQPDAPWKDEDRLRELYWEGGLSQTGLANHFGVSKRTIHYWMNKHGIERRDPGEAQRTPWASYYTKPEGYEAWGTRDYSTGKDYLVYVHRLLAVAEYGFEAVQGMDVHHKNGVKWDNRPENIEPMTSSDHQAHHWTPDRIPEWTGEMRERMSGWAKQRPRDEDGEFK